MTGAQSASPQLARNDPERRMARLLAFKELICPVTRQPCYKPECLFHA